MDSREFENGFEISGASFLKLALEPGSEWTSKDRGVMLKITRLDKERRAVVYELGSLTLSLPVSQLLRYYNPPVFEFQYNGPIKMGANCSDCNKHFEYQKRSDEFKCWACKNGY